VEQCFKVIAKVLANWLKQVLPKVISQQQSAFLPGRLISDNILVAYEALHTMATRLSGKQGYMAIKLYMSKIYDRVEWQFLEGIMKKLGFAEAWISLIMNCVRSVTYSVLSNGRPARLITPSRGLKQGDLLSPYLLCAVGLSSLLWEAEREGSISGVLVSVKGYKLSHLFFVDDSLLFCRANSKEWRRIHQLLHLYESASGQELNAKKTSICFSKNTTRKFKEHVSSLVGNSATTSYEKYLGLIAMVGRSKKKTFAGIQGRVGKKLEGWKEKFLSQAGKKILLKAVAQAIFTYARSVFLLPKTLCKSLNSLMNRFWWDSQSNGKKVPWMSWERMGASKLSCGMGLRDLEVFNLALLAK